MPIDNNIGHGNCTASKQEGLSIILRQHIAIVKYIFAKPYIKPKQYIYIDLYAGSGKNQEEDCDGSPVIFLREAIGNIDYRAFFIEVEPGNSIYLRAAVSFANHHEVILGDNRDVLPRILQSIPPKSYGLIYADPNGLLDFDLLADAAKKCPKLDVLIRYQAASYKRNGRTLSRENLLKIKSQWILRQPEDKHQWTFLFGTNYVDYKAWKTHGFYRWDDPIGIDIFNRLIYTREELATLNQMDLFPESVRSKVFKRSGGICEVCKTRQATEINHLSYQPPVDIPENMMAVCHQCHCKIHGVKD